MERFVFLCLAAAVASLAVEGLGVAQGWAPAPTPPLLPQVLYPAGTVVHEGPSIAPTYHGVYFTVKARGARLVGEIRWDHSSEPFGIYPRNAVFSCPLRTVPPPTAPSGGPWSQSFDTSPAPGQYWFGVGCWGAWANATVVWAVALLYP